MTLALQLLSYNGAKYIPVVLDSLRQQTDRDWKLFILENSTIPEEKKKATDFIRSYSDLPIVFEDSKTNLGFSGGHQHLFEKHDAELVFLINQDVILNPDYIRFLRTYLETHPDVGAVAGKILRWDWDGNGKPEKSDVIDSLGLGCASSQKVFDLATGMSDTLTSTDPIHVFGVSGCLPMYRRQAILDSSHDGKLFDSMYGSYKEDVDLAYRLFHRGWNAIVLPDAIAYHQRSFRKSLLHVKVSATSQFLSYRNHWWNLVTHISGKEFLKNAWAIIPFEVAKMGFYLVKNPSVLFRTWKETKAHWPQLMEKRKGLIQK